MPPCGAATCAGAAADAFVPGVVAGFFVDVGAAFFGVAFAATDFSGDVLDVGARVAARCAVGCADAVAVVAFGLCNGGLLVSACAGAATVAAFERDVSGRGLVAVELAACIVTGTVAGLVAPEPRPSPGAAATRATR